MTRVQLPDQTEIERIIAERGWTQGEYGDSRRIGPVCLHGAIRLCCPVPGDAQIIEQVDVRRGYGTGWNDTKGRTQDDVLSWLRAMPDITDDELAKTFGPQWEAIVALVRRAAVLAKDEAQRLAAAWAATRAAAGDAARDAAGDAARDAAGVAARDAASYAAWAAASDAAWDAASYAARKAASDAAWDAASDAARVAASYPARDAARDAAVVLVVRDLVGRQGVFTQEHYDTLTGPWRKVIGPVHPDDEPMSAEGGAS